LFGHKFIEDGSSPAHKLSSLENDSIVSFNRPDLTHQDIEEVFKWMKVINFLSEDIRSKNELIRRKLNAVTKLK
jgi:hypothetical protein